MNKINELIKELCPNGVQYKKIKEVVDLHYGKGNNIPKDGGIYPVYGCNGIVGNTSEYNNENTPIVGHIGSAGKVTWGKGKHYVTYNGTICKPIENIIPRFLYHVLVELHLERYVKGNQPFLSTSDFEDIQIPIPPIEIQEKITIVLDKFSELEAELEAELDVRKLQYKYWCGKLLNGKRDTQISEVFNRVKGTPITAKKMKEINEENGEIRIFAGGQTRIDTSRKNIPAQNIVEVPCVIVQSRGLIDFIYYDKPFSFKNEMWAYTCENPTTTKYLYYYLKNNVEYFRDIGRQMGSMPQISLPITEKFEIYLPSLEEQQRIVNILDKFEKLTKDIAEGLPAEIELRRKQYEYYRNKLLSFEE